MGNLIQIQFESVVVVLILYTCLGLSARDKIIFAEYQASSPDYGCSNSNNRGGECIDIRSCLIVLAMVADRTHHEFLKRTQCGFNDSIPMVCCNRDWNCVTANNEPGRCIPVASCPNMKDINPQMTVSQKQRCSTNEFDVCCSSSGSELNNRFDESTTSARILEIEYCEMTAVPPEPNSECCGRQTGDNRIIGGETTSIDQYPWAAALEYESKRGLIVSCGGTLISGKYVVTAAHCVVVKKPLNVRLGDYDIDNLGTDCTVVEGGGVDCTDEPLVIPIARTIPHPDYNFYSKGQANDIALLKLLHTAPYTDFIRPICLPTSDFTETAKDPVDLTVAGWGVNDDRGGYSPIKLHVTLPFVRKEKCFDVYSRRNVTLSEGQICAGGVKGKDSCKGDSGGALMLSNDPATELVGVVSFGFIPCGLVNQPGVYTKIHHYLPWIRNMAV